MNNLSVATHIPSDPFGMDSDRLSTCPPFDQKQNAAYNVGFSNGSGSCCLDMRSTGEVEVEGFSDFERLPREILTQIFSCLELKDLLSLERVCSYLSTVVRGNSFLWKTIHIDHPLNERITDDVLVQLTSRAQGKLECLCLVECSKISNDGMRRVLEANRSLN